MLTRLKSLPPIYAAHILIVTAYTMRSRSPCGANVAIKELLRLSGIEV